MDVTKDNFSEVADKFEVFVAYFTNTCTCTRNGAMTALPPQFHNSKNVAGAAADVQVRSV
jgi:hypothetical protein